MSKADLMTQNLRLRREVMELKDPPFNEDELEAALARLSSFFGEMNSARGAVTAANLYNREYFNRVFDLRFRSMLLDFLVEKFEKDQLMIEGTYDFWVQLKAQTTT